MRTGLCNINSQNSLKHQKTTSNVKTIVAVTPKFFIKLLIFFHQMQNFELCLCEDVTISLSPPNLQLHNPNHCKRRTFCDSRQSPPQGWRLCLL